MAMKIDDLIDMRSMISDLAEDTEGGVDISELPVGCRLLMLDAADFAEAFAQRLRSAVHALADRDGT